MLLGGGCLGDSPMGLQDVCPPTPVVAFVPGRPWQWPLFPTGDGMLIGGSGYVAGYDWPACVSPGLGLGALLFPSILAGSRIVLAGTFPLPRPVVPPLLLWQPPAPETGAQPSPSPSAADGGAAASPAPAGSDRDATPSPAPTSSPSPMKPPTPASPPPGPGVGWSKMGLTPVGALTPLPVPKDGYLFTPWGPVTGQPGPLPSDVPVMNLGFPTPDGTPVVTPFITWFQLVGDRFKITLLDMVAHLIFTPPSLIPSRLNLPMRVYPPVLLIGPFATEGRLALLDMLTGGVDPLSELPPVNSTALFAGASMSQQGAFIVYATLFAVDPATEGGAAGVRSVDSQIQIFDRRTRMINRLAHLNRFGPLIEPDIDPYARYIVATIVRPGVGRDILLYDLITGLVDPLPEVNTDEPETFPTVSACARYIAFVRNRAAGRKLYIFDRLTRGLDSVPDLDVLGPIVQGGISADGTLISITFFQAGELKRVLYDRRTGMIDPLPELNPVGVNRFIDLQRQGLAS
jgi:hypothetical protein